MSAYLLQSAAPRRRMRVELSFAPGLVPALAEETPSPQPRGNLLQCLAALWEAQGYPDDLLLSGRALEQAQDWAACHDGALTAVERDFLAGCQEAQAGQQRERQQAYFVRCLLGVVTAMALLLIGFWLQARGDGARLLAGKEAAESRMSSAEEAMVTAAATARTETAARQVAELALASAKEETRRAAYQLRIAEGRALSAQAQAIAQEDRQAAILLALEAVYRTLGPAYLEPDGSRTEACATLYRLLGYKSWPAILHSERLEATQQLYIAQYYGGSRLVGAARDGSAMVWDAATGERLYTLAGDKLSVLEGQNWSPWPVVRNVTYHDGDDDCPQAAAASPDERACLVVSWDEGAHIYFSNVHDLIGFACSRVQRDLTLDEWERYIGSDVPYRPTCLYLPSQSAG